MMYMNTIKQDQGLLSLPQLHMFDIGKRERKPTQSNLNEGACLPALLPAWSTTFTLYSPSIQLFVSPCALYTPPI